MTRLHSLTAVALLGATVLAHTPALAQAQPDYTVGQRLNKSEAQALTALPTVEINGRTLQILATATSAQGQPYTTVLGPNGVVGQTAHEVVIAEMPTQTVRSRLAAVLANAAAIDYQDRTNLTILRFDTLAQAATALEDIRAALPGVEAGIPIIYSQPRLR